MATAVVHGNDKTRRMMTFGPDERPRSLQIYGSDPDMLGRAVHLVCDEGLVDHVDLNFGCPAAKVTRRGGGAAVPAKPRLLRAIVRAAVRRRCTVRRARHGQVPDGPLGRPAHRRRHRADLRRRGRRLDRAARPHRRAALRRRGALGRDRRAEARGRRHPGARQRRHLGGRRRARDDRSAPAATASSSAVAASVGRGCSATWSRRSTASAGAGAAPARVRRSTRCAATPGCSASTTPVIRRRGRSRMRDFRKHTAWYMSGYPVGPEVRRRLSQISSLAELDGILAELDPTHRSSSRAASASSAATPTARSRSPSPSTTSTTATSSSSPTTTT